MVCCSFLADGSCYSFVQVATLLPAFPTFYSCQALNTADRLSCTEPSVIIRIKAPFIADHVSSCLRLTRDKPKLPPPVIVTVSVYSRTAEITYAYGTWSPAGRSMNMSLQNMFIDLHTVANLTLVFMSRGGCWIYRIPIWTDRTEHYYNWTPTNPHNFIKITIILQHTSPYMFRNKCPIIREHTFV